MAKSQGTSPAEEWGATVAARRRALGITQAALAWRTDSDESLISAIECGRVIGSRGIRARIEAALAEGPARGGEAPIKHWQRARGANAHGRVDEGGRFRPARRKCLSCGDHFMSSWCGERMCGGCKATTAWMGA